MKAAFVAINTASRLNLLVVMAACKGANLVEIVGPTDRAPVWAILGPSRDLRADQIGADFPAFYDELLGSRDGRRALERLNDAPVGQPWRYEFVPARYFFRVVFQGYVREMGTPEALQQRETAVLSNMPGTVRKRAEVREWVRVSLADHAQHFRVMRERFFMIDLFPENDQRFVLSYADCLRDPADDPDDPATPSA